MQINIAVCDDEIQQVQYIKFLVNKWIDENNIAPTVEMFDSAENFMLSWSEKNKFDILLLDIEMDGQSGMELAREIRQSDNKLVIIFITGYTDYISDGYDVSAMHYLIKPVKENKLFEVLDKAVKTLEKQPEFLILTINREDILIPLQNIIYIESSLLT